MDGTGVATDRCVTEMDGRMVTAADARAVTVAEDRTVEEVAWPAMREVARVERGRCGRVGRGRNPGFWKGSLWFVTETVLRLGERGGEGGLARVRGRGVIGDVEGGEDWILPLELVGENVHLDVDRVVAERVAVAVGGDLEDVTVVQNGTGVLGLRCRSAYSECCRVLHDALPSARYFPTPFLHCFAACDAFVFDLGREKTLSARYDVLRLLDDVENVHIIDFADDMIYGSNFQKTSTGQKLFLRSFLKVTECANPVIGELFFMSNKI